MGCCSCFNKREIDPGNIENSILSKLMKENPKEIQNQSSFTSEKDPNFEFNKKLLYLNRNTIERDLLPINQQRADTILDYFNQIKMNPQNFLEEAKEHDVIDILNKYINSKIKTPYLKNRFYNSLLESYVNRTPKSDKEIEKGINSDINLSKYDKQFYVVMATIQDPNESIWTLIKQNKSNDLNKLLDINISYLSLYVYPIENTPDIKVYFLFLQLKKN